MRLPQWGHITRGMSGLGGMKGSTRRFASAVKSLSCSTNSWRLASRSPSGLEVEVRIAEIGIGGALGSLGPFGRALLASADFRSECTKHVRLREAHGREGRLALSRRGQWPFGRR